MKRLLWLPFIPLICQGQVIKRSSLYVPKQTVAAGGAANVVIDAFSHGEFGNVNTQTVAHTIAASRTWPSGSRHPA